MFKVNYKEVRRTSLCRSGVFIVNFDHIYCKPLNFHCYFEQVNLSWLTHIYCQFFILSDFQHFAKFKIWMLHLKQVLRVKKKSFKQWKQYFWRENQRWRVEVYYIHDIFLRDHINIFWFCQADIQACALNSKYITTKNLPGVYSSSNSNILVTLEKLFLVKDGVGTDKIHTWSPLCRNLLAHLIPLNEVFPKKQF